MLAFAIEDGALRGGSHMLPAPHPVFGQVGVVLVPIRSGARCRFTPLSSELNLVPVVADLDVQVEV